MSDESDKREDRREAYGYAKGHQAVAAWLQQQAIAAFNAGNDADAKHLRALSLDVNEQAAKLFADWRASK